MTFPIRVRDVMSSPVQTASPVTSAADAASQCLENDVNSLVVIKDGAVSGIVTGTDLLRALGTARDPASQRVGDLMSSPVVTVEPETPIGEAAVAMRENGIARLVVLDGEELVGLVSTDDIVRHVPQPFHRQELSSAEHGAQAYRVRHETAYELPGWTFESTTVSDDRLSVGDRVEFSKTISDQDVRTFATASGDTNRLHLDEAYAAQTRFGRRIVHGTLVGGLISAALARLPGLTIYLSQDLSFHAPVDIGDRVTAVCEIVGTLDGGKYELTTDVVDANDEQVIEGQATVLVDQLPESAHVDVEAIS